VVGDADPVHHERDQLQGGQVGGEQLSQGLLGSARDRRLRGGRGDLGDLGADRFQPGWVRRVESLASMRSSASWPSRSVAVNAW
jgi:hypothetical protein